MGEMFSAMKEAFELYRFNIWRVLILSLTIVLPIQIVYTFLVNYVSMPFLLLGISIWPNIIQIFFLLIAFSLIQVPFASMVSQEKRFETVKLGTAYGDCLANMFSVYILGIVYAICAVIGMFLLLIPGLLLILFLVAIPQSVVVEEIKGLAGVKRSFKFVKSNFKRVLGLFGFFIFSDMIISGICYFFISRLTDLILFQNIVLMFINLLLLPLFSLSLTYLYFNWKNRDVESGRISRESDLLSGM